MLLESTSVDVAHGFAALADAVRLRLISVLATGGRCVCDLQDEVPVAPSLLSYHLRVLRESGLVTASRRGRWVDYRLSGPGFAALWATASAAGVPLPGEQVTTARAGRATCDTEVLR